MGRRWHLEHADGREWTQDELDQLATDEYEGPAECAGVLVDQWGRPFMRFGPLGSSYVILDEDDDVVVVWDG